MQLSLLCSLALLSWITWTACWMMWVNNCLPIMMYYLQHLLNLRKVSYLQQWFPHQQHYLAILLNMEAPPEPRDCVLCGADGIFQCTEGAHQPVFCTMCCQAEHKHQPFHRVEQWNGTFFEESSLQLASLVLHVGHGGKHCPASGCSNDEVTTEEEDDWEDMPWGRGFTHTADAGWDVACYHKGHKDCIYLPRQCGMWYLSNEFLQQTLLHNLQCLSSSGANDRHRELLRVARMWWLLKLLKWQGSHMSAEDASPRELVLFCPACPQPNINIPEDATDYSHWTLARSLVMDGNFKAEHMHPKDTGSKAWLMDGKGYMVASQPYKEYLSSTKNVVEISDCSNHWAVNQANANQQQLTSTGIGGCACAWHGCFVLHAMVNFQKGKQQVNMDYALVHAISHGTVPGQQVDGEIMETLWSSLNIISPSARGMATPHQQEATAMRLKWKLKVAEESYLVVEGRFADLNGNVPLAISQSWGEEVAVALDNQLSRPQAMDIYEVRLQKGFGLSGIEAPSAKAIKIDLLAIPQPGHSQGMVTWIVKALKIEEAQIQLAVACWHITSRATEAQNLTIAWYVTLMELQLWQGQANDCLHELWLVLAEKAVIFQTDICHGSNYHMAMCAWGRVANAEAAVQCHATVYCQCHIQMGRLGAGPDILEQYKELNDSNLTISMAVSDPNARGHRDDTLPWIWTMDVPRDMATNDWMSEFYRVNWLQMRALWDRWKEEYDISSFMLYLGMRFCCLVTAMKKLDWSEYWHTSWYQHFLAEVVSHCSCGGAMVDSGTGIKECHVKLATIMAHAWWQNDSGKVELGYERRPLQDIMQKLQNFLQEYW
ncbi:hypothetical protein F5J12DRAFT_784372 [Pisolithus orientalis]|uniref:uncharacterized protein n=1 Tax=Pisolithus orientalis TaxID=936130 RepID=UPI002224C14B|nr:uncharacterized protein F5J12DRAFT_784372 [Pisolithus orientalis]KAI6000355.1 hypothetical protein F5J12DRAFT_784372 [Pisolithus orientalis]